MKSLIVLSLGFILLVGCAPKNENVGDISVEDSIRIIIGATEVPHAEILEQAIEPLRELNIELDIKRFSNYQLLNSALADGDLDANFFQHSLFLEEFNNTSNKRLVSIGGVHLEPMGGYSKRIFDIEDLPENATITIPDDVSNGARALLLLEKNGLIRLNDNTKNDISILDIVENSKNLDIKALDAALIASTSLPEVYLAIINTNFAIAAGLNPLEDSLIIEDTTDEYIENYSNIVVVREEEKDLEHFNKLMNVLQSDLIRNYIEENYNGHIIPVF